MPSCALLCNVGNLDIAIYDSYINEVKRFGIKIQEKKPFRGYLDKEDFRSASEALADKFASVKDYLVLPIIEPLLKHIQGTCEQKEDLKVFLFATDQPNNYKTDTFYAAHIIRKFLIEKKNFSPDRINIIQIRENPSDHIKMIEFYINKLVEFKKFDKIYISITAGTPQQNLSLFFLAFHLDAIYARNVKLLYVEKPKKGIYGKIREINLRSIIELIHLFYLKNYENRNLHILAYSLSKAVMRLPQDEKNLITARYYKMHFQFNEAKEIIEELLEHSHKEDVRKEAEIIYNEIRSALNGDFKKRQKFYIKELINNILMHLDIDDYLPVLEYIRRLRDVIMETILLLILDKDNDIYDEKNAKEIRKHLLEICTKMIKKIKENEDSIIKLLTKTNDTKDVKECIEEIIDEYFLKNCDLPNEEFNYNSIFECLEKKIKHIPPSFGVMIRFAKMLQIYLRWQYYNLRNENVRTKNDKPLKKIVNKISKIIEICKFYDNISKLRNKSVIGHGWEGVSLRRMFNTSYEYIRKHPEFNFIKKEFGCKLELNKDEFKHFLECLLYKTRELLNKLIDLSSEDIIREFISLS